MTRLMKKQKKENYGIHGGGGTGIRRAVRERKQQQEEKRWEKV